MRNLSLLPLLLFFSFTYGQAPTRIAFDYDGNGNQVKRYICVNCSAKIAKDSLMTEETVTDTEMIKDELYEQLSYYPNPVREELYIQWQNNKSKYITGIELYSITGQALQKHKNLKGKEIVTIPFLNYPSGYYNVVILYNDGEKKTLKIVKK